MSSSFLASYTTFKNSFLLDVASPVFFLSALGLKPSAWSISSGTYVLLKSLCMCYFFYSRNCFYRLEKNVVAVHTDTMRRPFSKRDYASVRYRTSIRSRKLDGMTMPSEHLNSFVLYVTVFENTRSNVLP